MANPAPTDIPTESQGPPLMASPAPTDMPTVSQESSTMASPVPTDRSTISQESPTIASSIATETPTVSQEQMSRLPLELRRMILDIIFEAVFIPGEVVPHQKINHINEDCFVDSNEDFCYKYTLRSLDNHLYEKYKNRYWSDNIWVPRPGPACDSTSIFRRLPIEVSSRIKLVRLVLSAEDGRDPEVDFYQVSSASSEDALNHSWFRKIQDVFELQLEKLVLDVSDAFSPQGNFLDVEMPSLFEFRRGVPKNFGIIASNERLARKVWRRIRKTNEGKA